MFAGADYLHGRGLTSAARASRCWPRTYLSLVYVCRGVCEYLDDHGGKHRLKPGHLMVIPPGVRRAYGAPAGDEWDEHYVSCDGPLIDLWLSQGLISPEDPFWRLLPVDYWVGRMIEVVGDVDSPDAEESLAELGQLQILLADMRAAHHSENYYPDDRLWLTQARRLLDACEGHERPNLQAAAKGLGCDYAAFRRRFTRLAGIAPRRYRLKSQVDLAKSLIARRSGMSNKELASACGFADEYHFSKQFKCVSGGSPRNIAAGAPITQSAAAIASETPSKVDWGRFSQIVGMYLLPCRRVLRNSDGQGESQITHKQRQILPSYAFERFHAPVRTDVNFLTSLCALFPFRRAQGSPILPPCGSLDNSCRSSPLASLRSSDAETSRLPEPTGGSETMRGSVKGNGSGVLGLHWTKATLLATFAVASIPAISSAALVTISTDFYGTAPEANQLVPTDVAGVPAYAASNWNLVSGSTIAPASAVFLHDSTGNATGVTLSIDNAPGRLSSFPGTPATGNAKLYNGAVGRDHWFSPMTFTLTGLEAFKSYDLIIYTEADYGDANRIAKVDNHAAGSPTYYGHAPSNTLGTAPFALITSTTQASPSEGNYMSFGGLTASSLTVSFWPDNYVYVTGFQVVGAVPEPMAISLFSLAIPALLHQSR